MRANSYAAARIHAMRTRLIKPQDYERLLKMSETEIIGYLQATEYRKSIDELQLRELTDPEMIDRVLALSTKHDLEKLRQIASKDFNIALNIFLEENDLWNLGVIADALSGGTSPEAALQQYARRGTINPMQFSHVKSIEELGKISAKRFPELRNASNLAAFRNAIDVRRRRNLKSRALATQRFIIDELNLLNIIMRKREKLPAEQIRQRLLRGGTIGVKILEDAARAGNLDEVLRVLRSTQYAGILEQGAAQQGSMVRFESELHAEILRRIRNASAGYPLHPELLLRYLTEKEIERENIRLLVKGKILGLEEQFLRAHLVT